MPRGGYRPNSGPVSKWQHGTTRTIRVPVALAEQVELIARRLDRGELPAPAVDGAVQELEEALKLKPNAGGAIKQKIRQALALLGKEPAT